uniref:Uncharacterized protein n=1 Tax=Anguilla anguilla TaxID=7936 RepID=A0A0E9QKK4_ANGAN
MVPPTTSHASLHSSTSSCSKLQGKWREINQRHTVLKATQPLLMK